ncbi:S41 family peptidase [Saccharicrinis sp. FJH2]|uniref:S41 family peptidase n=1 Tax=Saccharicrinis sp. FJH65 TaxID=3344659 RepID=UPI0035F25AD0
MRKKYWFIFILVLFTVLSSMLGYFYIQKKNEYRQIAGVKYYNSTDISNLAVLCKIWGFVKYYHPSVVEGKYNWDDELINMMPKVLKSHNKDERNLMLSEWLASLENFEQETLPELYPDSVRMYPDLDWITDKTELGTLSDQLERIKTAKRNFKKDKFIQYSDNTISGEAEYNDPAYPVTEYRLLALFRFWNVIQYYYPYKYLISENWHKDLIEFIPKFIDARNELEYKLAILELITKLNDTHAGMGWNNTIEKWKGENIAPYQVSFVEGKLVVTGVYAVRDTINTNHSIQVGDVILSINKTPVENIIAEKIKYTPGSNYTAQLRRIADFILRTNEKKMYVEYQHDGIQLNTVVSCYTMNRVNITSRIQRKETLFKTIGDSIGYLYLGSTNGGVVPQTIDAKGLIIDLRCYPVYDKIGGYMDYALLYTKPQVFVKFTMGNSKFPGLFQYLGELTAGSENPNAYNGKKIILVNEVTQSHAEFIAMKYSVAENSIIIGSTTAGADGDVISLKMPGGIKVMFTGAGVYYPDGRETQGVGIVPDIEVKPTIQGIKEGRDEVLNKAIELISEDR